VTTSVEPVTSASSAASGLLQSVSDLYDPAQPNDYTMWCEQRIAKRAEEQRQRELQRHLEEQERMRQRLAEERQAAAKRASSPPPGAAGRGRGVSNLPAWMKAGSGDGASKSAAAPKVAAPTKAEGSHENESANAREGAPTAASSVPQPPPASATEASTSSQGPEPAKKKKGMFGNPTPVLLLKNMVAPGDVDDELSHETKIECGKYGPVKECVIFEVTERSVAPEEAVRTFVSFEKQESAVKAFLDLEGRFFAGRKIACEFYDPAKFERRELDP